MHRQISARLDECSLPQLSCRTRIEVAPRAAIPAPVLPFGGALSHVPIPPAARARSRREDRDLRIRSVRRVEEDATTPVHSPLAPGASAVPARGTHRFTTPCGRPAGVVRRERPAARQSARGRDRTLRTAPPSGGDRGGGGPRPGRTSESERVLYPSRGRVRWLGLPQHAAGPVAPGHPARSAPQNAGTHSGTAALPRGRVPVDGRGRRLDVGAARRLHVARPALWSVRDADRRGLAGSRRRAWWPPSAARLPYHPFRPPRGQGLAPHGTVGAPAGATCRPHRAFRNGYGAAGAAHRTCGVAHGTGRWTAVPADRRAAGAVAAYRRALTATRLLFEERCTGTPRGRPTGDGGRLRSARPVAAGRGRCRSDARAQHRVDALRVAADDQQGARTLAGDGQDRGDGAVRTAVEGHHHDGAGSEPSDVREVSVEDVVTRVVLGPVGGFAEGQLVGCPGVRLACGHHQHLTGRAARVEEQVDGLFGGIERAVGGGRDELDLRGGRSRGLRLLLALGLSCRARGPRTTGARRRRGTRAGYGAGGLGAAACGRSRAGTLGTLGNLRLLGTERHDMTGGLVAGVRPGDVARTGGRTIRSRNRAVLRSPQGSRPSRRAPSSDAAIGASRRGTTRKAGGTGSDPVPPGPSCAPAKGIRRWRRRRSLRAEPRVRPSGGHGRPWRARTPRRPTRRTGPP
ncbi:hypothetical protein STTU_1518 [Streptomyces sp. Tu6071]|nr:hypothetical protein STTU_1518 [Streptomyces sp. Tu6071]